MIIARTETELRRAIDAWRTAGERVAFVPTMGALHAGHLSLVRLAREHASKVVASVFVNPTQFGPNEDFNRYPRQPEADAAMLETAGCDLLFLPEVATIYPPGNATFIEPAGAAEGLEGACRPGHFRGVGGRQAVWPRGVVPPLDLEAAQAVDRLRGEPEVGHHRHLGVGEGRHQLGAVAFDLHPLRPRLLDEADGVGHRVVGAEVERAIGHVRHQQGALDAPAGRFGVVDHLVHGDRQRVRMAQHDHGERVAHQDDVHSGRVGRAPLREVVGGDHHDAVAALGCSCHPGNRDAFRFSSHCQRSFLRKQKALPLGGDGRAVGRPAGSRLVVR